MGSLLGWLTRRIFHVGGDPCNSRYLFLGDYVDRADRGIQVLCLLMAYKLKYPNNVFLLRGNHESIEMNDDWGFKDECLKYYSETLYKDFQMLFNCLPIAAIISNKILYASPSMLMYSCVHGGLSRDLTSMKVIKDIQRPCAIPMNGLLSDLLWSDPCSDIKGYVPSPRDCAYLFGPDIVEEFMSRFDFDLIVRGHECCDGYCFAFNRKLVTVFSAPNYCGVEKNAAGIMFVDKELSVRFVLIRETRLLRRSSIVKPDTLEIINR